MKVHPKLRRDGRVNPVLQVIGVLLIGLVGFAMLALLPGCGGVQMKPQYSQRLDQAAALTAEDYKRISVPETDGGLTRDEAKQAIGGIADFLQLLRDARDGKASPSPTPVTNPTNVIPKPSS